MPATVVSAYYPPQSPELRLGVLFLAPLRQRKAPNSRTYQRFSNTLLAGLAGARSACAKMVFFSHSQTGRGRAADYSPARQTSRNGDPVCHSCMHETGDRRIGARDVFTGLVLLVRHSKSSESKEQPLYWRLTRRTRMPTSPTSSVNGEPDKTHTKKKQKPQCAPHVALRQCTSTVGGTPA